MEEREQLILRYMSLAKHIAYKLWREKRLRGFDDLTDVYQEAYRALILAVDAHDSERADTGWYNYLHTCISRHLLKRNVVQKLVHPTVWSVSRHAKENYPEIYQKAVSLPSAVSLNSNDEYLSGISEAMTQEEDATLSLQKSELRVAIAALTPQERELIERLYGLNGPAQSLRSYAKERGLSYETIRLHRRAAFEKIRERLEGVLYRPEAA